MRKPENLLTRYPPVPQPVIPQPVIPEPVDAAKPPDNISRVSKNWEVTVFLEAPASYTGASLEAALEETLAHSGPSHYFEVSGVRAREVAQVARL